MSFSIQISVHSHKFWCFREGYLFIIGLVYFTRRLFYCTNHGVKNPPRYYPIHRLHFLFDGYSWFGVLLLLIHFVLGVDFDKIVLLVSLAATEKSW